MLKRLHKGLNKAVDAQIENIFTVNDKEMTDAEAQDFVKKILDGIGEEDNENE